MNSSFTNEVIVQRHSIKGPGGRLSQEGGDYALQKGNEWRLFNP